jgi:hypothetical protein
VKNLGRLNLVISDALEKKFRLKTIEKYGGKKGSLSIALEKAIELWLENT